MELVNRKKKVEEHLMEISGYLNVTEGTDVRVPKHQLNQVLSANLGLERSSNLTCFDYEPMAAASIGQEKLLEFASEQPKSSTIITNSFKVNLRSNIFYSL